MVFTVIVVFDHFQGVVLGLMGFPDVFTIEWSVLINYFKSVESLIFVILIGIEDPQNAYPFSTHKYRDPRIIALGMYK